MPYWVSLALTPRRLAPEPPVPSADTSRLAISSAIMIDMALAKVWKAPPTGPPPNAWRKVSPSGMGDSPIASSSAGASSAAASSAGASSSAAASSAGASSSAAASSSAGASSAAASSAGASSAGSGAAVPPHAANSNNSIPKIVTNSSLLALYITLKPPCLTWLCILRRL